MATADEDLQPWHEHLLAELRRLGQAADPVPPEVSFAARGSFAWRRIDAELAELTFDSALDEARATVRGGDAVRLLTFEAGQVSVEVEVTEVDGHRSMIGQLVPPQPAQVEVRAKPANQTVDADELGRFAVAGLEAGPTSIRCRLVGTGQVIETGWLVL
jgi:hypothetical protein